jgi:AraC-like DNA-binding protein
MPNRPARNEPDPHFFSTQVLQARRFFLNLNPRPRERLSVACGGVEHCAPNYVISRPTFAFYSIEFVVRGLGRLRLGAHEHRLQPGSIFSYGPGIPHQISTDPEQTLTKYFVDFAGRDAAALLKGARLRAGAVAQIFPPMEIQPLFEELIRNGRRGTRHSPGICAMLLEALALKILESPAPMPGRETLAFATYRQCRDHISRHFQRLRSVKEIARECHLDDAYLCRLFKRYDQETPYRFLVRLKMNYAAERLQSPATLVKQVAEDAGFANPFHFSRAFKSMFGISPIALSKIR